MQAGLASKRLTFRDIFSSVQAFLRWMTMVGMFKVPTRPFFTMVYPCGVIPNEVRDLLFCR